MQVDPAELHLLILLALAEGPCREAAALLEREAVRYGLLPVRTDFLGVPDEADLLTPVTLAEGLGCWCARSTINRESTPACMHRRPVALQAGIAAPLFACKGVLLHRATV